MRNILLIAINSKYIHTNLALRYMRQFAEVQMMEFTINDDIFSVYRKLMDRKEEYFCFSTYIWNIEYISKLAGMIKKVRPDLKIILGGPEAGYDLSDVFEKYNWLFGCVSGEGELFCKALKEGLPFDDIPNFSYKDNLGIHYKNEITPTPLSEIKFPYTEKELNSELQNRIAYFETSRGCIFNCSYCLSSNEGKTRTFDLCYVKEGLLKFIDKNIPLVKFVDRTFNENNERAMEIVSFILEHNKNTRFHFEVAPQLLTKEFVSLCAKSPEFFQFEMGIQTTNHDTMRAIRRVYDFEKTAEKILSVPKSIHTHLDLIAGLPYETFESFKEGFNKVYSLKPNMLQVGFLKLLKHTKMKDEADNYSIETTNFPPYEVLSTDTLSAEEIIRIKKLENAVDRIYNSGSFDCTINEIKTNDAFEFYLKIGEKLYDEEYEGPLSKSDLYVFLYKEFPDMKKSLTIDFLKNNRKAILPECFAEFNPDAKKIHKYLAKLSQFQGVKFRLCFASGATFILYDSNIIDVTELIAEYYEHSQHQP